MPHRQTFVLSGELRFPSAEHLVGAPKILRATVRPMSVFDYSLASLGKRGPLMTRDTWWYALSIVWLLILAAGLLFIFTS
jgi:hypothetical protein